MRLLKWLLINQIKCFRGKQRISGFTLIELLVGIVLAFLVITPLMGFMISVMDSERKEQAKTTTEQELKATLDYITRDLQQAVYIYDAAGIDKIRQYLPKYDQKSQHFPVLVFWKRRYIKGGLTVGSGNDDTFVYSLVAYYLINDGNTTTWSNVARIGRFELSDGYGQTDTDKTKTRDNNFKLFDLSNDGNLRKKMNQWTNAGAGYSSTQIPLAVVDYIDQTPIDSTKNPAPNCPSIPDSDSTATPPTKLPMQVPDFSSSIGGDSTPASGDSVNTQGFYVCVDSTKTVAEVHLRGNSFARLQMNQLNFDKENPSIHSYFPTASTRVQGIGLLFTK